MVDEEKRGKRAAAAFRLEEQREISWRFAVEAEEEMNKVREQSKSPTFGFGCKPGGEETRSVLV